MKMFSVALLTGASVLSADAASAAAQAYWRFEDKNGLPAVAGDFLRSTPAPGGTTSGGNTVDVTSDSSGNGNELRTFHSPNDPTSPDGVQRLETSPAYTLNTPSLIVPQTGAANLFAFDFDGAPGTPQQPPGTLPNSAAPDDIYSLDNENVGAPSTAYCSISTRWRGPFALMRSTGGNPFSSRTATSEAAAA